MRLDHSGPLRQAKTWHDELYAEAGHLRRRLEEVRRDREQARESLLTIIFIARRDGMTWKQIGDAIGVSAQRAQAMFHGHSAAGIELIVTGDRWGSEGPELGAELWRVPFAGWGEGNELRVEVAERWVPRRYAVVREEDGQVLASNSIPGGARTLRQADAIIFEVPAPLDP